MGLRQSRFVKSTRLFGSLVFLIPLTGMIMLLPSGANSFYFELRGFEKKCFKQGIFNPEEKIIVNYETELIYPEISEHEPQPPNQNGKIYIEALNKDDVLLTTSEGLEGSFSMRPPVIGEYKICFRAYSELKSSHRIKVHFAIKKADNGDNVEELIKLRTEAYTKLEGRALKLKIRLTEIMASQSDRRVTETLFREISDQTNGRVVFWVVTQLVFIILFGVWQVKFLERFCRAKKLI